MIIPFRDKHPSRRRPYVTYALISTNILIFLAYWPLFNDEFALQHFFFEWGLVPAAIAEGYLLSGLVTSMFLHGGIMHLAFNMLGLHIYGDNLEDVLGHFAFLAFYLACGIASAVFHSILTADPTIPTIGASGAVSGVMGGYLLLFPRARIDVFIFLVFIIRVVSWNAWVVLGVWFLLQLYGVAANAESDGVAYWAHVAGFAAGAILAFPAWLRLGGPKLWARSAIGHECRTPNQNLPTRIPTVRRRR